MLNVLDKTGECETNLFHHLVGVNESKFAEHVFSTLQT
jgi:hypothetical protein